MAAIDKLRVDTYDQYSLFADWVDSFHPSLLHNMYPELSPSDPQWQHPPVTIANFRSWQDRILLWRCPFRFVRQYLHYQCGLKTRWYHRIFFQDL